MVLFNSDYTEGAHPKIMELSLIHIFVVVVAVAFSGGRGDEHGVDLAVLQGEHAVCRVGEEDVFAALKGFLRDFILQRADLYADGAVVKRLDLSLIHIYCL